MKNYIMLIACIGLLGGCATVAPGDRGVKVSLGRVDNKVLPPGMVTYNPLTDEIEHISIQQQTVDGKCEPLTADQQQINIEFKVQYRVPEGQLLNLFQNYKGSPYESLVAPQIQEAFRQVVSGYKADSVTKDLTTIKNKVLLMVQENVKGLVEISDIPITHVSLPEVLQKAIADKQVMEQQSLQKAYELDKAKKEAEITVANARAQAESIKLQTEALQKSPQLVQYEAVKKWNGSLPSTLIMDAKSNLMMKLGEGQ